MIPHKNVKVKCFYDIFIIESICANSQFNPIQFQNRKTYFPNSYDTSFPPNKKKKLPSAAII